MHFLCMECEGQTLTGSIHAPLDSVWIRGNTQSPHNTQHRQPLIGAPLHQAPHIAVDEVVAVVNSPDILVMGQSDLSHLSHSLRNELN
jgi:hypothetical protein